MVSHGDVLVPMELLGEPVALVRVHGDGEVVVPGPVVHHDQEPVFRVDGAKVAVRDVFLAGVGEGGRGGGGRGPGRVQDVLFVDDSADYGPRSELVSVEWIVVKEARLGHARLVPASRECARYPTGCRNQGAADEVWLMLIRSSHQTALGPAGSSVGCEFAARNVLLWSWTLASPFRDC